MIRPWYRSRLIWAGSFGLVFLLWCWWDSMHHSTWLAWQKPAKVGAIDHSIMSSFSEVSFSRYEDPFITSTRTFSAGRFPIVEFLGSPSEHSRYLGEIRNWFGPAMSGNGSTAPFASAEGFVEQPSCAYWFLVLIYLFFWCGLLVAWQHWKRRRLSKELEPPEPDPE